MAAGDLLFDRPPVETPGPVHLVFGDDTPETVVVEAVLQARLPGPRFSARVVAPNDVSCSIRLGPPGFNAQAEYNSNTARPLVGRVGVSHQVANKITVGVEQKVQATQASHATTQARHGLGQRLQAAVMDRASAAISTPAPLAAGHGEAQGVRSSVASDHSEMLRDRRSRFAAVHAEGIRTSARVSTSHQDRYRDRRPLLEARHSQGVPVRTRFSTAAGRGAPLVLRYGNRHQEAMRPPAGRTRLPLPPLPEPCYLPDPHLVFSDSDLVDSHLVFICERHGGPEPGATLVIPIRRLYMVANTLSLTRVSDGLPVPASSASISLDIDSWTWGFGASIPGAALPLVDAGDGDPVELLLQINGMSFRVRAENLSRNRVFGRSDITVRGRGRSAVLAGPDAPILTFSNSEARTAQQLAIEALTFGGVPLGWDLDWRLEDWLVPAGAWLRQGTHIEAVLAIAQAAGGYVQPHAVDQELIVLPRYPALPRDWAGLTPDVELPSAVVSVENIEWLAKPAYNRVFAHGVTGSGLRGEITLAGTAGDLVAPMVVDPLLTDTIALTQRGRAILGDTGRQARVSLRVPALTELGLVGPGKLVRYVDGAVTRLGLARSVQLEATHAEAWQTIGVETHV